MRPIKLLLICILSTTSLVCAAQAKKKAPVKKTTSSKKAVVKKPAAQTKTSPAEPQQNTSTAKQSTAAKPASSNAARTQSTTNTSVKKAANELGLGNGKHVTKGTTFLNAGIGFSNYGLPLHLSIEKLVVNDISVGIFANGQSYNALGAFYNDNHLIVHGGVKSNFYFNHLIGVDDDKWYFAAGISAGYWRYFYEGSASNLSWGRKGGIYLASQIDLRYCVNKHWSVLLQGNYGGMNAGIIGVTYTP
jgi:outer membrane immunogenic protein